jgi:serine phosphatase RsbU (regulator of sigma subunit)/integral membrane sensor domain MASE1
MRPRHEGVIRRWRPLVELFVPVAVLYAAGAELTWHASGLASSAFAAGTDLSWRSFTSAVGVAFFPSVGVTVSAMLLTGRRRWPVIVAASIFAAIVVDTRHGVAFAAAAGFALAKIVESLVGASVVRSWCRGAPDLRRRTDLARFVTGACLLGPLAGGLLGAAVGVEYAGIWWPAGVLRWLVGDGVGVLVVGAPVLLWPRQRQLVRSRRLEVFLVTALTAVVAVVAFRLTVPPALLLLPLLAWAAFRLQVVGAAMCSSVVAFAANYLSAAGFGIFTTLPAPVPARLAATQGFIVVLMAVTVLIGQEASSRVAEVKQRQAEQRERVRLRSLAELGQALAAATTPEDIGEATASHVRHAAGADALALGLISDDGARLSWLHMAGYPSSVEAQFGPGLSLEQPSAVADAVHTAAPVLIRSSADYRERYPQTGQWMIEAGAASIGSWPLMVGSRVVGVLGLMWSRPQPFDAAQCAYASAVASLVTQAGLRARAYADEHTRAETLQAAVLPARPTEIDGLEIAVWYEPAAVMHGLGGDWWDALPLPKNRTYLAVGDVVGHGLPAVEDMAQLRAAGRALAIQGLPPAQLLAELNIFTAHTSHGQFATVSVAIFDHTTGILRYGSAGHPPPLLRTSSRGEVCRLDGGRGPVLGPLRKVTYDQDQLAIHPGDILVMYTDGLIERRGNDLDTVITEVQHQIADWQPHISLDQACRDLGTSFAAPQRKDDTCILAVRFRHGETAGRKTPGADGSKPLTVA